MATMTARLSQKFSMSDVTKFPTRTMGIVSTCTVAESGSFPRGYYLTLVTDSRF